MKLWLARHGYAGDYLTDPQAERQRPLTPAGRVAVRAVGANLRARGERPKVILASPLRRTMQTADILGDVLGAPVEPFPPLVPHLPVAHVLRKLAARELRRVLVVGHTDNLSPAAAELLDLEVVPPADELRLAEVRGYDLDRKTGHATERFRLAPADLGLPDPKPGKP